MMGLSKIDRSRVEGGIGWAVRDTGIDRLTYMADAFLPQSKETLAPGPRCSGRKVPSVKTHVSKPPSTRITESAGLIKRRLLRDRKRGGRNDRSHATINLKRKDLSFLWKGRCPSYKPTEKRKNKTYVGGGRWSIRSVT